MYVYTFFFSIPASQFNPNFSVSYIPSYKPIGTNINSGGFQHRRLFSHHYILTDLKYTDARSNDGVKWDSGKGLDLALIRLTLSVILLLYSYSARPPPLLSCGHGHWFEIESFAGGVSKLKFQEGMHMYPCTSKIKSSCFSFVRFHVPLAGNLDICRSTL